MHQKKLINIIYEECMLSNGFVTGLRENQIHDSKYKRLLDAIKELTLNIKTSDTINRLVVACLYEVPWEMENTIPHYKDKDPQLGRKVSMMAQELRMEINNLLWNGLEKYYEDIESS